MKKIDIFIFRVICIFFSVFLYLNFDGYGEFLSLDYKDYKYIERWGKLAVLILGFLLPFCYFTFKKKVINKVVLIFEIIFFFLYVGFINVFNAYYFKDYSNFMIGILQISICYCIISWLLLSYYKFDGED